MNMNTAQNSGTCCITNLTLDELNTIHASLSHQVIDICRHMAHDRISLETHNSMSADMTQYQKIIHKIGVVIESRKAINNAAAAMAAK